MEKEARIHWPDLAGSEAVLVISDALISAT